MNQKRHGNFEAVNFNVEKLINLFSAQSDTVVNDSLAHYVLVSILSRSESLEDMFERYFLFLETLFEFSRNLFSAEIVKEFINRKKNQDGEVAKENEQSA